MCSEPASKPWEQSEAIFKLIADEDLVSLKCLISTGIDINQRNNEVWQSHTFQSIYLSITYLIRV